MAGVREASAFERQNGPKAPTKNQTHFEGAMGKVSFPSPEGYEFRGLRKAMRNELESV